MKKRKKLSLINIIIYIMLIIASLGILIPVLWMLSTSLKADGEIFSLPLRWITTRLTFESFLRMWVRYPFIYYFRNSIVVVCISTITSVFFSTLAGYGASRFRFKSKNAFLLFLLFTQMFPFVMLLVPYYQLLKTFGMTNSLTGLTIVYISFTIPFCTWMMKGYFESIPKELDDAAAIDGCGKLRTLFQVIFPLAVPGVVATAIYSFIAGWNEYMFASVLTSSEKMRTVAVGVASLIDVQNIVWNDMMASSLIASIPLIIIFIVLQRYFIGALIAGAVKQ